MTKETNVQKSSHYAIWFALTLILFSANAHAAQSWEPAVGISLLLAIFLIATAYMVVHMLKLEAYKTILHDEVGQVIMTAVIVGVLIFGAQNFDQILKNGVFGLSQAEVYCADSNIQNQMYCETIVGDINNPNPPNGDIRTWALEINENNQKFLRKRVQKTTEFINQVGDQSSQSGMCNMLGIGFTIAGCSSWGILRTPAGQMLNAAGFASMDLQAERILLEAAKSIALPLLLPLGVLLRSIYFTRQAGSTLIALAISLYFIFPTMIIAGQAAGDAFLFKNPKYSTGIDPDTAGYECDPFDPEIDDLISQMDGIVKGKPSKDEKIIFFVVGKFMLMTALSLTATLTAVRGIGHVLGTEINVMSIARLS